MPGFSTDSKIRHRRWLGAVCLLTAVGMVVADEFVFKGRLPLVAFFAYWLVCFLLTITAAACALADLRTVHRRSLDEQRNLMEETLRHIERERDERRRNGQKPGI